MWNVSWDGEMNTDCFCSSRIYFPTFGKQHLISCDGGGVDPTVQLQGGSPSQVGQSEYSVPLATGIGWGRGTWLKVDQSASTLGSCWKNIQIAAFSWSCWAGGISAWSCQVHQPRRANLKAKATKHESRSPNGMVRAPGSNCAWGITMECVKNFVLPLFEVQFLSLIAETQIQW